MQSVARAVRIMHVMLRSAHGVRAADLVTRLGLHKTTVHRLLRTLESEGLIQRHSASRTYSFSPALFLSARPALRAIESLRTAVQGVTDELTARSGHTCVLAFPDETRRNVMATVYSLSPRLLRMDPSAQPFVPTHQIAPGKCYLAGLPSRDLGNWLKGELPRATRHTMVSPTALQAELARVREQGYATCEQEAMLGTCGLAVPVHDDRGAVVGALALGIAESRLPKGCVKQWLPSLRSAAAAISGALYGSQDSTGGP